MSPEEELLFLRLHALLGNKWARIAAHVSGSESTTVDFGLIYYKFIYL